MPLPVFATVVRLNLIGNDGVNVVFMGPFINIADVCKAAEPTLRGWSRAIDTAKSHEEMSVAIEFNYGDIIYRDIQYIYPQNKGGTETTLFWLDHAVHDWLAKTVPGYYLGICGWCRET